MSAILLSPCLSPLMASCVLLLSLMCRDQPKRMQGRELTAPELRQYVISYVKMFKSGSKFPEAKTMLEVTAYANNQNAR